MKSTVYILFIAAMLSACGKAEVVTFKDKSTVIKADRSTWTATASSEELTAEAAGAALLLDGKIATYWHSEYSAVNPPYPHWVQIDMKTALKLVSVEITARQNNANAMTKFKLEGSTDGTIWSLMGDNLLFTGATKTPQSYPVSSSVTVRYLKLTALEGPVKNNFIAEIEAFASK
ncbi:hypothetical protein GFS24_02210 [Chitinophaga sp. SYP-B3965]|uniref:discoidin domain-containing protein n=1 Tax=Chitinophaga sp. SYP-B3965 TaxID=2663120 RepID=UPI00129A07C4|nr:discoidin domain-containing protein [Chitinophaga sp. SYP-B3965]MRG43906.1 hypothetical protein [Chitinophaga sp. SYP-B3965]